MERRLLAASGIEIAPLIFGGNVFGWTVDEKMSFTLLDQFVASGFNCIDTADVYSRWFPGNVGGESETIIGRWLKQRKIREKVVIATKVGSDMGDGKKGLARLHILRAAEDSLRRLQTDYIDLYQSHFDDLAAPVEETLEAYAQLISQGKVRIIGASNMTPERLTRSLEEGGRPGFARYQCLQPLYNLYDRAGYEEKFEPICQKEKLTVIPYSSLASGYLTGKYRSEQDFSKSLRGGGVRKKYFNARGLRILGALDVVAKNHRATPGSVALAWLMGRPGITAPIVSATNPEQWGELVRAPEIRLDEDSLELLDQASV